MNVRSPRSSVDHVARVVDERDEGRGLAAGRWAAADFLRQALRGQLGDQVADRGPGQAGEAGDLRAADRAEVVQRAQDEARVVRACLGVGRLGREFGACHGWLGPSPSGRGVGPQLPSDFAQ